MNEREGERILGSFFEVGIYMVDGILHAKVTPKNADERLFFFSVKASAFVMLWK